MRVLVADQFEQSGLDGLHGAGCEVVYDPTLKDEALASALTHSAADVLVVRSTKVSAPMMQARNLALIVRAGAGYNTIDVAAASKRGIYVSNCPGRNAIAVAELALGLILALDRRIPDNVAALRAGSWNKKEFSKARGLYGRTLTLLGFGNIGQELARRAQACGLHLVLWSRSLAADPAADLAQYGLESSSHSRVTVAQTPEAAIEQGDIVSLHLALAADTKNFLDRDRIARLKPGAMLINTARAELLDHDALAEAIRQKGLRVGLDVFRDEPSSATGEYRDELLQQPTVYGTHHIGASTEQAQEAIAAETVRIVRAYKETGRVPNVVNLARRTPATAMLVVRHRDRPGVLAHVFDHLRNGDINVQETENVVFEGAEAAVARINVDKAPTQALLALIQSGNEDIISLQIVDL